MHNFGTCIWRTDAQWRLPGKNVFRRRKNRILPLRCELHLSKLRKLVISKKNGNQGSLYLYTMLGGFFSMDCRVRSPRAWRCRKRARPCLEKSRGGFLNKMKHKQILKAKNTKTSKLQLKNLQDRACRIELADLGLKFPLVKSILPPALLSLMAENGNACMTSEYLSPNPGFFAP